MSCFLDIFLLSINFLRSWSSISKSSVAICLLSKPPADAMSFMEESTSERLRSRSLYSCCMTDNECCFACFIGSKAPLGMLATL